MVYYILIASLLMAACSPTTPSYWFKAGSTQDDFRRDQTECEVAAIRDVPVRESNTPIVGGQTNCRRNLLGSFECSATPGVSITSDDNQNLRNRALIVCLERRGWRLTAAGKSSPSQTGQYAGSTPPLTFYEPPTFDKTKFIARVNYRKLPIVLYEVMRSQLARTGKKIVPAAIKEELIRREVLAIEASRVKNITLPDPADVSTEADAGAYLAIMARIVKEYLDNYVTRFGEVDAEERQRRVIAHVEELRRNASID